MGRRPSSAPRGWAKRLGIGVGALTGIALTGLSWGVWEARWFELRRVTIPVLPTGRSPVRILHVSDLHLVPRQRRKQDFVSQLAALEPDLVINTGDNLGAADAVEPALRSYGDLLDRPGVFVFGSNDYYGPRWKNPLTYFKQPKGHDVDARPELPWERLRDAFLASGWLDLNHQRATVTLGDVRVEFRGTDDAHLHRDDYSRVAGLTNPDVDLAIGVTHAPYARVIDPMVADGCKVVFAGHTHGGQVCVPGYGALVSNCDLPPKQASGLSHRTAGEYSGWLHVSNGLGTSPTAPFRFACRPSATLVTLTS